MVCRGDSLRCAHEAAPKLWPKIQGHKKFGPRVLSLVLDLLALTLHGRVFTQKLGASGGGGVEACDPETGLWIEISTEELNELKLELECFEDQVYRDSRFLH